MRLREGSLLTACLLLLCVPAAPAGMPSPLPINPEQVLRLNESPLLRLQTISFFLAGLLLCAALVMGLWNGLRRDFPQLPRLTYFKALAGVVLWGLLFIIVLTMISGARELMTPGAWKKQGFTYRFNDDAARAAETAGRTLRRQHLERLRTVLWQFAATHQGRFPSPAEAGDLPADLWEVPDAAGLRYRYFPGLSADSAGGVLVCEPELDLEQRFVLQANGEVVGLRSAEVNRMLKAEGRP